MPLRVTVIGAGIVGVCCALSLQRDGHVVTVLDPGGPGGHASASNAGMISGSLVPLGTPGVIRDVPRMLSDPLSPLRIRWSYALAIAPWLARFVLSSRPARVDELSRTLVELTLRAAASYEPLLADAGAEDLIRRTGLLLVYMSDATFEGGRRSRELRRRHGIELRVLDGREAEELEPTLRGVRHAVWLPTSLWTIDPGALVRRLAARFSALGGRIVVDRAVGFRFRQDRPVAVVGARDEHACDAIVVAAGPWSRPLALALGDRVPLDTERGYIVMLPDAGVSPGVSMIDEDHHIAVTPMSEGLRVTGMSELAGLTSPPDPQRAKNVIAAVRLLYPDISTAGARWWMSYRPSMPDTIPVIGRSSRSSSAIYAFGHGHSGLGFAAITGRIVADLLAGRPAPFDVRPLGPDRFAFHRVSLPEPFGGRKIQTPELLPEAEARPLLPA